MWFIAFGIHVQFKKGHFWVICFLFPPKKNQDGDIVVEYKPMEDSVDPSNMLCAGKVWILYCVIAILYRQKTGVAVSNWSHSILGLKKVMWQNQNLIEIFSCILPATFKLWWLFCLKTQLFNSTRTNDLLFGLRSPKAAFSCPLLHSVFKTPMENFINSL